MSLEQDKYHMELIIKQLKTSNNALKEENIQLRHMIKKLEEQLYELRSKAIQ